MQHTTVVPQTRPQFAEIIISFVKDLYKKNIHMPKPASKADTIAKLTRGLTVTTQTTAANTNYSSNIWTSNSNYFNVINGIQYWTVPETNYYLFEICGSNGYDFSDVYGGRGRIVYGLIYLKKDQKIKLLVGQLGNTFNSGGVYNAGGSGASFVVDNNNNLLFISGAGGNSFVNPNSTNGFTKLHGIHASYSIYGTDQYGLIKYKIINKLNKLNEYYNKYKDL
jgi:hypothetical protein